jgi:hypothetical protein
VVFRFWKKKPVKLQKNEEVEVSCPIQDDSLPEVFVTRVVNQSPRRILLQIPPAPAKHHLIQQNSHVTIHFKRENHLGSFGSEIIDIQRDEIPPSFAIAAPSQILWEEIVPAKLVSRGKHRSHRKLFLKARLGESETEGMAHTLNTRELLFSCGRKFEPGESLTLLIAMPEGTLTCQAEIIIASESPDEGLYEITASAAGLEKEDHEKIVRFLTGE